MRRVRYQVASSLDGFIAGPHDDFDWIIPEPTYDFEQLKAQFDTLLMGRRTYEIVRALGESFPGKQVVVASRTLQPQSHPEIEVVSENLEQRIRGLRAEAGRDIWLYGGGELFAQALSWGLVDTVELAVIPILLGSGIPFLPAPAVRQRLTLVGHRAYPSGMLLLEYEVQNGGKPERGFQSALSAPARRALAAEGITTLAQLSTYTEADILKLHGIGPSSMPKLRAALTERGLNFKSR